MTSTLGRRAGFSLLEVLVAMMVLAIGASSVLSLFAAAAGTHKRSVDRTNAALVAERVVAEVEGRYARGMDEEELRAALSGVPELFGEYAWTVDLFRLGAEEAAARERSSGAARPEESEATPPEWGADELLVRVNVNWKSSGQARTESFFTIILPRNVPGIERKGESGPRRRRGGSLLLDRRRAAPK